MADAAHRPGTSPETAAAQFVSPEPRYRPDERGEGRREIPVWEGTDRIVSQEIRIVGPNGEKVDVMTFRGSFERDLKEFAEARSRSAERGRERGRRRHRDDPPGAFLPPAGDVLRAGQAHHLLRRPGPDPGLRLQRARQAPAADQGQGGRRHRGLHRGAFQSPLRRSEVAERHRRAGERRPAGAERFPRRPLQPALRAQPVPHPGRSRRARPLRRTRCRSSRPCGSHRWSSARATPCDSAA